MRKAATKQLAKLTAPQLDALMEQYVGGIKDSQPISDEAFLRRVTLGRAIAHTAVGPAIGAAIGRLIETVVLQRPTVQLGVVGALLGFFVAAVRLRIITRRSGVEQRVSANGA